MLRKFRLLDFLNPLSIFLISYFLFIGFGLILSLLIKDFYVFDIKTIKAIVVYPISFVLFSVISKILMVKNNGISRVIYLSSYDERRVFNKAALFSCFGILGFCYLFYGYGSIPLLHEDAEQFRVDISKGNGEYILIFTAFIYVGSIYLSFLKNLNSRKRRTKFLIIATSFVFILFNGYRSPAFYYLLIVFLSSLLQSENYLKQNKISYKKFLLIALLLPLASIIGLMRAGIDIYGIKAIFINLSHLVSVNTKNLDLIILNFDTDNFFYGYTYVNDLLVAVPGSTHKFTGVILKDMLGMSFVGETMTLSIPGEAYVNGGILFVIICSAFQGVMTTFLREFNIGLNTLNGKLNLVLILLFTFRSITGGIMPILIFAIVPVLLINFFFRIKL